MALPANVQTSTVKGQFILVQEDLTDDVDLRPEGIPVSGMNIRLTPMVSVVKYTGSPAETLFLDPIDAFTNQDGFIEHNGALGIQVVASNSANITPKNFTYQVRFTPPGHSSPIVFNVMALANQDLDLTMAVPVPADPGADVAAWVAAVANVQASASAAAESALTASGAATEAGQLNALTIQAMERGANSTVNPGFESGFSDWAVTGNWELSPETPYKGLRSARFPGGENGELLSAAIPTVGETVWEFQMAYRTAMTGSVAGGLRVQSSVDGVSWTQAALGPAMPASVPWSVIRVEVKLPSTARFVRARITFASDTSTPVWVDEVVSRDVTARATLVSRTIDDADIVGDNLIFVRTDGSQKNVGSVRGPGGQSAYEIWLTQGNVGTVEEWQAATRGQDGSNVIPTELAIAESLDGDTPARASALAIIRDAATVVNFAEFGPFTNVPTVDVLPVMQNAVNAAAARGKPLYIPAGEYGIRTTQTQKLTLPSNFSLILDPHATLYRTSDNIHQMIVNAAPGDVNISLQGGTLSAVSPASGNYLGFEGVTGLSVTDITMLSPDGVVAAWLTRFKNCNDLTIRGVRIRASSALWKDGLHIYGGRNIRIADCDILAGDDAIALTVEHDSVESIENVVITNCVLRSWLASAVKVHTTVEGKVIRNVSVSNLSVIKSGGEAVKGWDQTIGGNTLQDIQFSNINITVNPTDPPNGSGTGSVVLSFLGVNGLSLSDVNVQGARSDVLRVYPSTTNAQPNRNVRVRGLTSRSPVAAGGINIRHVQGLSVEGIIAEVASGAGLEFGWAQAVDNATIAGVNIVGQPGSTAGITFFSVSNSSLIGCRVRGFATGIRQTAGVGGTPAPSGNVQVGNVLAGNTVPSSGF